MGILLQFGQLFIKIFRNNLKRLISSSFQKKYYARLNLTLKSGRCYGSRPVHRPRKRTLDRQRRFFGRHPHFSLFCCFRFPFRLAGRISFLVVSSSSFSLYHYPYRHLLLCYCFKEPAWFNHRDGCVPHFSFGSVSLLSVYSFCFDCGCAHGHASYLKIISPSFCQKSFSRRTAKRFEICRSHISSSASFT